MSRGLYPRSIVVTRHASCDDDPARVFYLACVVDGLQLWHNTVKQYVDACNLSRRQYFLVSHRIVLQAIYELTYLDFLFDFFGMDLLFSRCHFVPLSASPLWDGGLCLCYVDQANCPCVVAFKFDCGASRDVMAVTGGCC